MKPKTAVEIDNNGTSKKVYFGDDGQVVDKPVVKQKVEKITKNSVATEELSEIVVKPKKGFKKHQQNVPDLETKWYQVHEEYNTTEFKEIKDSELTTLHSLCRSSFNDEIQKLSKNNPSDSKWLTTALHKGTSKDRANAGALLVQTNPLPNSASLESLITLTKLSNKTNIDVFDVVTDLFINSLLPHHRKLIPLQNRGNDWKVLKSKTLEKSVKDQIYAYWHYENELRDHYHGYLINLQASLQNGKEVNKVKAIIAATKLLKSCPERESFLLAVLVNKFGDPDKKIASKATYNLRQILLTHPNMARVMVLETEKLIFRNNITELAQHYGIGFLSLVAPIANVESSQKLINICFCFFKIKIEKGDINSKTMQAILNCLRIAIQNINDFNEDKKTIEITTPDVVNTIYRLIYLSNASIAFQALSLLLQLVLVQDEKHDRFYNALYRKMLDQGILNANNKITSLYFHIIHRSIQQDKCVARAKAFIKRLLQMTLSFPPAKACGALVVINKILKTRPELMSFYLQNVSTAATTVKASNGDVKLSKFDDDSDSEETYKDVMIGEDGKEQKVAKKSAEASSSSWIHVQNANESKATVEPVKQQTAYDPFKRAAAYCGAEFSMFYELVLMSKNFHPTVQVFVENILKDQKIKYFGDPLKDFSLAHFLERFSFKNPKKADPKEQKSAFHQAYQAKGARGQSVYLLTEQTCTEDEKFIFDFIQRKREIKEKNKGKFKDEKDDDDCESVDDDEFDAYLDSLGAKKDLDKSDRDFDYMSEVQKDLSKAGAAGKSKKQAKAGSDSDEPGDDWDSIEGDSDASDDDDGPELDDGGDESGTDQSIDENEMSDDSMGSEMDSGDDMNSGNEMNSEGDSDDEPSAKKAIKSLKKKSKGKGGEDLFVAVDDFSEMIEKNSSSSHGTLGEIFNKDKSSQKQMDWEQKRHDAAGGGFKRKKSFSKKNFGPKKKMVKR